MLGDELLTCDMLSSRRLDLETRTSDCGCCRASASLADPGEAGDGAALQFGLSTSAVPRYAATANAAPHTSARSALNAFKPFPTIPRRRPQTTDKLTKVRPAESHFIENERCLAWSFADKVRRFAREKSFKDLGLEVKLRRILIVTNGNHVGVIRPFQLRFDLFDFVLLHQKKIAVKIRWHVSSFVVADPIEVSEHPRKRISAGANEVASQVIVGRIPFSQCKKRVS